MTMAQLHHLVRAAMPPVGEAAPSNGATLDPVDEFLGPLRMVI